MLWEILQWVLPKAIETKILSLTTINQATSNIILALYMVTHKRTAIFGTSFLVCEIIGLSFGFGMFESEMHLYLGYLLITCYFAKIQIMAIKDSFKSFIKVSICSMALIALFAYASYDAHFYSKTETLFFSSYADILLLIHVCIILSFYNVRRIYNGVVSKLSSAFSMLRNNYTTQYFCYTISYRFRR